MSGYIRWLRRVPAPDDLPQPIIVRKWFPTRLCVPPYCWHQHRQLLIGPADNPWLPRAVHFLSHLREIRDVACIQINL
jgi:hypothetical protein